MTDFMTAPTTTTMDDERTAALAERLFGAFIQGSELLTIELGRRLGLYDALHRRGTVTSGELAAEAGITERYAREWLEQQTAAAILELAEDTGVATTRRFEIPAPHVPVLLDPDHPANVLAFAPFLTGFALTLPAVTDAYRTGTGISYEQFGSEVRHGIGLGNRPMFHNSMPEWFGALPDLAVRLRLGGNVLDAGCGTGYSSVALARTFDRIRVHGIDMDAASIEEAAALAEREGLSDRVQFTLGNAADPGRIPRAAEGFDVVTYFEALHDMGDPVGSLRAVRPLLARGGAVLIADERVSESFTGPADEIDRLMYAASVLHCLPATMAESETTANGTVLRASTVQSWAAAAGYAYTVLPVENPVWRFYRLDPLDPTPTFDQ